MSKEIINFIKNKYNERHEKNSNYSLRAFSRDINIEHSSISKILSEKRPLTFETANKILSSLNIQTSIKNSLLLTIADEKNFVEARSDEKYITLTEQELSSTYKWYHYAFLSVLEIEEIEPTVESISSYLNLDIEVGRLVADTLTKLGSIQQSPNNYLALTGNFYTTTNNIKSNALVKAHIDHIEQSNIYLQSPKNILNSGDYSGITMAIPIQKMDETKRRIKEFRRSLAAWLSEDDLPKTDVYRLNIQFFPLGRVPSKK